jgi:hypothetical protein
MSKAKLSSDDIDHIVSLLTSWRGNLTWEPLVDALAHPPAFLGQVERP